MKLLLPFPKPQVEGVFLERPQRFLAKVRLSNGKTTIAYCPNSGSFAGCLKRGNKVLLWDSQGSSSRKLRYTLRAIKFGKIWIGTDTHLTNRIAEQAFMTGIIPPLTSYNIVEKEKLIEGMRIDFVLRGPAGNFIIEVKSSMVADAGLARFPDSISGRSVKQLEFLKHHVLSGGQAALLFIAQRSDVTDFVMNSSHDSGYTKAFHDATRAGVKVFALGTRVMPSGFFSAKLLNIDTCLWKETEI